MREILNMMSWIIDVIFYIRLYRLMPLFNGTCYWHYMMLCSFLHFEFYSQALGLIEVYLICKNILKCLEHVILLLCRSKRWSFLSLYWWNRAKLQDRHVSELALPYFILIILQTIVEYMVRILCHIIDITSWWCEIGSRCAVWGTNKRRVWWEL